MNLEKVKPVLLAIAIGAIALLIAGCPPIADAANPGSSPGSVGSPGPASYTLIYAASGPGHLTGTATQTVQSGGSGQAVSVVADAGSHFLCWKPDNRTDTTRIDTNVTSNVSATAYFAADGTTYTLSYSAGTGGSISGNASQTVSAGGTLVTAVTAVPASGYRFLRWSDGLTNAERTDLFPVNNLNVTAYFIQDGFIMLSGNFALNYQGAPENPSGWAITANTDPAGNLANLGTTTVNASGAWEMRIPAQAAGTTVYFGTAGATAHGYSIVMLTTSVSASASDVFGISLSISIINLSGTATMDNNGTPQDITGWYVLPYTDRSFPSDSMIVPSPCVIESGAWSIDIPAYASPTRIYFAIAFNDSIIYPCPAAQSLLVQAISFSNISLHADIGEYTISGTVSGFTDPVFFAIVQDMSTMAAAESTTIAMGGLSGSDWSTIVDSTLLDADLYFIIGDAASSTGYYVSDNAIFIPATGATGITLNRSDFSEWNPPDL